MSLGKGRGEMFRRGKASQGSRRRPTTEAANLPENRGGLSMLAMMQQSRHSWRLKVRKERCRDSLRKEGLEEVVLV